MRSYGSQGETCFPHNFVFLPKTAQLTVTCCYHPQSWQEVIHRGLRAAISPLRQGRGLSYFRRLSTGLPLLLLRNPEIQWGPFMLPTNRLGTGLSAHSTELGRTLNVHRLAQIQVNYYIKRKTQKIVQNKEIKLGFRTPEPQPQPSL